MKSLDNVGVTFVSAVIGRGSMNGVVNLTLGTYLFTPSEDGTTVNPDLNVSARLRMDKMCAQQIVEALGTLLNMMEQEEEAALKAGESATGDAQKEALN